MYDLKEGVYEVEAHEDGEVDESRPILSNSDSAQDLTGTVKTKNIWKDSDWRQKSVVLYVSAVNYLNFLCNSSASPFLARVVLQKGGTIVFSTLVLQTSMITMAIFSIIFAKYQSRIGSKRLIISGQVIFSLSQTAFGTIDYFHMQWALVTVGTLLKAIQGVCQAACNVAGLTILCQQFPHHTSAMFGIFEAANGAGYLTGPYLGGFLYDWSGGMMVPMVTTGLLSLMFAVAGIGILKNTTEEWKNQSSEFYIMKISSQPIAVVIIGAAGTSIAGLALCDSTITVYLKSLGFSVTSVGQILFLMGISYCLSAVLVGFITNKRKLVRRFVLIAGFVGGLAFTSVLRPTRLIHGYMLQP